MFVAGKHGVLQRRPGFRRCNLGNLSVAHKCAVARRAVEVSLAVAKTVMQGANIVIEVNSNVRRWRHSRVIQRSDVLHNSGEISVYDDAVTDA